MPKTVASGTNGLIYRQFNPKTNNIDFFVDFRSVPELVPFLKQEQVNLSRGHTRMYSLTTLSDHNGSGANWKDGQEIHTRQRCREYVARVEADIADAFDSARRAYEAEEGDLFDGPVSIVVNN